MRGGSSPKKGGQAAQALGRSRGGFSTKIHVSVDGLGNPLRFILTGGQQHDITQAEELIACPASTIFAGWRQSVLPVHLLGVAPLLGCVGAVAGDVKLQDDGVMDHPVDCRGGGHGVGEDAFPLREDQV